MARIDFHSNVADKLEYACRLTRKIWSGTPEGQPVRNIVMVGEKADLKKLDELLWTFSNTDFLPHCFIDDELATETPIVLSADFASSVLSSLPHADVMIHLGIQMPQDVAALVARFPRIVEVVTEGRLDFGPWEQIFYGEFDGRRKKRVLVKIIGE